MRLGPERWARAPSPVRRYKLMTSNIAECINSCLRHARKMPKTVLIECIRGMFQSWFHDRHNEALNLTKPLRLWATDLLNRRFNETCHFSIQVIDWEEFQVIGGTTDIMVNLSTKTCSCGEFQTDLLPCMHAVAAISANVQPLNSARTITRLDLEWRDMRFPFARLGIPVSGTSPMTFNKVSFCRQVDEVKWET
ncbi:Uncharacterized protein TCM_017349 [Theobroma cacao]|uniref:SWIM-type domain-containing protein n=1 Tax=Theobroma cacao TaxID=3641 RepID=A0A061ED92_THECC|nr:Uncharacterized protein TCM_017349 [Theobroma cacao]